MAEKGLRQSLVDLVLFNHRVKRTAISLLNSRVFTSNPAYKFFYKRKINGLMREGLKKPLHVMIENTNACNSNCITCARSSMKRGTGVMPFALYKKIIADCLDAGVDYISVNFFGEPLLDKGIFRKISYAKQRGIRKVILNSNAQLLNEKAARGLVASGADELFISVDAASKEVFERIRRNLDYETVESNIISLMGLREKFGSSKPRVILDFVEIDENRHQTKEFISKWENIVDEVCITSAHNWAGEVDGLSVDKFHSSKVARAPCKLLWTELVVCWDGLAALCCQDVDHALVIGDLKKQSIKGVWQGKLLEEIRRAHIDGEFDKLHLCKNCSYHSVWWFK